MKVDDSIGPVRRARAAGVLLAGSDRRRLRPAALAAALVAIASAGVVDAGETRRVSVDSAGAQAYSDGEAPSISASGRYVAFCSRASTLAPDDTNGRNQVFVHDRVSGATVRVSVDSSGMQANSDCRRPSISGDGRFVAFESQASNLVPGDTNGMGDIFLHDRATGYTSRVSVSSAGVQGNSHSETASIAADGRFVAFWSSASNLVSGDTDGFRDVFVRDRATATTSRVSVSAEGVQGNGHSVGPSISADGRFVAFESDASNLVPGDGNSTRDVFVHDRASRATSRVSVDSTGVEGSSRSYDPSISADGRFVAFTSLASNLVAGDYNYASDVIFHDRATGTTSRASVNWIFAGGNSSSAGGSTSGDGRFVAFSSRANNLVRGDRNGQNDVFVHDRVSSTTMRVSIDSAGIEGNLGSYAPSISADGCLVAFSSNASNFVPGDTNGWWDVFVHDRAAIALSTVVPATGSETGGDLVHLFGRGFTAIPSPTVSFGAAYATVLSVEPNHLAVMTPPGADWVDVTVSLPSCSDSLSAAYQYVAPELAARFGNVNVGLGDREDVLFLNASIGEALTREVVAAANQPLIAAVIVPSTRAASRFAVYLWPRTPRPSAFFSLPHGLGAMVLPPPLLGGSPPVAWNNAGHRRVLGAPTLPSQPAPAVLFRSNGIQAPVAFTLQGFIEDDGSQISEGWSVTNALVVRVE